MHLLSKILTLTFLFISLTIYGQDGSNENRSDISLSIGGISSLDTFVGNAYGFHLGMNLFKVNSNRLGWDSQLAVNMTNAENSNSTMFTFMAIGGGRYCFVKKGNGVSVFMNFMAGFALEVDLGDDYTETLPDVGYSVGSFFQKDSFLLGISIESAENLVFKIGYRF